MWAVRCKHPAASLVIRTHIETVDFKDPEYNKDFEKVIIHLFCRRCGEDIEITYAKCRGSIEEFLARKVNA